jgi:hypothetical protein
MKSSVSTVDAFFNVFPRKTVPILLPYATMPKGSSEWTSQAVNFHVMRHCFISAAVYPGIHACNDGHRDYLKGLDEGQIQSVLHDYYDYYMQFNPLPNLEQNQDRIGPFSSTDELNQHMIPLNISKCEPLLLRFAKWEKNALDPTRRKEHFYLARTVIP